MEERALISSIQTEFPVKWAMRMRLSRLIACYNAPPPPSFRWKRYLEIGILFAEIGPQPT